MQFVVKNISIRKQAGKPLLAKVQAFFTPSKVDILYKKIFI